MYIMLSFILLAIFINYEDLLEYFGFIWIILHFWRIHNTKKPAHLK